MTPSTTEARRQMHGDDLDDDDDDGSGAGDGLGSPVVTHFGVGQRFERRDPEGFESLSPPTIPSVISRINPLLRLASLGREDEPQRADSFRRPDRPPLRRAASVEREADLPEEAEECEDSPRDEGEGGGGRGAFAGHPGGEDEDEDAERKIKVSNFPQDSYWFRSQKDREDSIIETRAETIYDDRSLDRSLDRRHRRNSSRVFHVNDDDASYS